LYLSAKLVEAHQGKIWIESQGKGEEFFMERIRVDKVFNQIRLKI